jgi:hypothetical protein
METRTKKRLSIALIILALLLTVPAWFASQLGIIPRIDPIQTFHAPVLGPDGKKVYYLTSNVWGISWGPGIEFFTGPATAIELGDRIALQSTSRDTGKTTTLQTWRVRHLPGLNLNTDILFLAIPIASSHGTAGRFSAGYDTSCKLNEYLDADNKSFIVETGKGTFLMNII